MGRRWGGWGADRGLEQRVYDADGRRGAARGHALDDAGGRRELPLAPERLLRRVRLVRGEGRGVSD